MIGSYISGCGFSVSLLKEASEGGLLTALDSSLPEVSLIIVVGGTFVGRGNDTPEILGKWSDYQIPGIGELMRFETVQEGFGTYLQRGGGWIKDHSLIVAVPADTKAALDHLKVLGSLMMMTVKGLIANKERASIANQKATDSVDL
jgi:molybdopterin biosynthesis enzyme MoaB